MCYLQFPFRLVQPFYVYVQNLPGSGATFLKCTQAFGKLRKPLLKITQNFQTHFQSALQQERDHNNDAEVLSNFGKQRIA